MEPLPARQAAALFLFQLTDRQIWAAAAALWVAMTTAKPA